MARVFQTIRLPLNVPLRPVLQGALLAITTLMTPATGQEVREEHAVFDITLVGLAVATLEIASRNDGTQYAVSSYLGGKGLAKVFVPTSYRVRTRGLIRADRFVPTRYVEERMTGQQMISRTMTFRQGTIDSVVYDPPDQAEQEFREQGSSGPSHDLINALYTITRDRMKGVLCTERSVTFNGTDWTILQFGEAVTGADGTVSCQALVFSSNNPAATEATGRRYDLQFTYTPHPEDAEWYILTKVAGESRLGPMTIRRRL